MIRRSILLILTVFVLGCSDSEKKLKTSFFVAGHAYGDPRDKGETKGLYQPLKDKLSFINEQRKMNNGFFLGDVVYRPNAWPEALNDMEAFKMPLHVVRGNHEGPIEAYENRFGESYKSFIEDDNLFIILDTNLDKWNISGEQLVFLMNTIRNQSDQVDNIFIFTHHVMWWSEERYKRPRPNSLHNRAKTTNYWTKLEPFFQNAEKPVFLFAGDVGAFSQETAKVSHTIEYFYLKDNNITYVSSGMGGGVNDNVVFVDIYTDGTVGFRLIHLNGDDVNGLGKLEDYRIPN